MNKWEPTHVLYEDINEVYDYGIVLSGFTLPDRPPYDRVQFSKGADRIAHAIDLYKLGKIKKIIISGGSGVLTYEGRTEATMISMFAITAGVLKDDIITENRSRNTRENAYYTSRLIDKDSKSLLITSAFHMHRASKCFDKVNIKYKAFPTDYYGDTIRFDFTELLPQLQAIELWTKLFKEWLGIVMYRIVGYI
ncbi:YdcF family protein [Reichenbachiella versicolor]|uniref:YdcF family protein n=1 Tax=Reichenbachiella versicolor TaxID=1821036 RepID=UPI0013A55B92|nr:YdcF family protein [Reichenbachiella versicolor]